MTTITKEEFNQALDQLITTGLNSFGPDHIYAQLSVSKQFVEVVYNSNVAVYLNKMQQQQMIAAEAARQLEAQQGKANLSLVPPANDEAPAEPEAPTAA